MKPGVPPKPTALHVISGALRKKGAADKARRAKEMRPHWGVGDAPTSFNAEQVAVWARLVEDTPPGVLARTDRDAFANYVLLVAARDLAVYLFNATGAFPLIADNKNGGMKLNPYFREFKHIAEAMRLASGEFGYTPAARVRVSAADDADADPLEAFLDERKTG
jgi:P27 family predicted phage terminase small subunit